MFERLKQMFIKEITQVLRDPRMRGVIFIAPVVQLIVLSYAVTMDVKNIRIAVCDYDQTPQSREFIARLAGSAYFTVAAYVHNQTAAQEQLDRGDIQAFFTFASGFARDILAGRTAPVQVVLDGTDSNSARIIMDYATLIAEQRGTELLLARHARASGERMRPERVRLDTRTWFNPNLESRNFFVPGVIALVTALVGLMLTSMAIVRERELGTMEQLIVSPIKPLELILGKTVPFALLSLAEMTIVLLVALLWFHVPFRGSFLLLYGAASVYLLSIVSIGLFISTICRTQQQAMLSTVFFFMPAILLSGLMFPIANMPLVVQWITCLNPLRYFIVIVRSVFLKGVGIGILWPEVLALAAIGTVMLMLAAARFRKTIA